MRPNKDFLSRALLASLAFVAAGAMAVGSIPEPRVNRERVLSRLDALASIGRTPEGGVSRVAFSAEDIAGRAHLVGLMKSAGLAVRLDAAGNLIGRLEGSVAALAPIVLGSHADTVPNGGRFDGALGVVAALECVDVLREAGLRTRHPLEVVIFADEEGGLIGSRAMAGALDEKDLAADTQSGMPVRRGIEALGGDPARLAAAARRQGEIAAYLEIHIEQGGTLDSRSIPVGVVEGIVAIARWDVTVEGFANHAGTTPMAGRRDALLAAARFILAVNRVVTAEPGRQVGTVGRLRVEPGAVNVIPGRVELSLELRDLSLDKVRALFAAIRRESETIAGETGTAFAFAALEETPPALTDARLRDLVRESAQELGLSTLDLPSGAGHDAQAIGRIAPIGMIFVRSAGGISHSPREFSAPEDIVHGVEVLVRTLQKADRVF